MRRDGRVDSRALLFLLLAATSLVCSCKSVDVRVSEDTAAMVNARKKIKAEAQLAAFKHEQTLKDQCQSAIDQEKEKHRKELADKEKEIANLKGSHGGKTSDDSNSNSNFNSNSKSLPPGLRPPRG